MHIDFEQGSQQVAANKTLKYQPEEIDWILNKIMNRFVQSKLKPKVDEKTGRATGGFEVSQLDADAIRTIIVSSYDLVPYIDQDQRRYRCFLPPDYSYLLSDWSYTTILCGDIPQIITENMGITALRQELTSLTIPKFYKNLQIQLGTGLVSIPSDLPYGNSFAGFDDTKDMAFLRLFIQLQGKWYWERFDNIYFPSYYINATTQPQGSLPPFITVDGVTTQVTKVKSYQVTRHKGTGKYFDNRLSATDDISGMNSTEFIKSSYYSPISELSNGILYIYNDPSFIVSSVGISYIRKPQPISLYLNTDCELPEEFHRTICDLAVEYVKNTLENTQGTQLKGVDIERRVTL